jgi:hypothetical protein
MNSNGTFDLVTFSGAVSPLSKQEGLHWPQSNICSRIRITRTTLATIRKVVNATHQGKLEPSLLDSE